MFTVTLSDVGGGATLGNDESIVTINDDDVPGTLAIQSSATVEEDVSTGNVTLKVSRTGGSDGVVSVDYTIGAVGDTATAGSDYTAQPASGTLTFGDGVMEQDIVVPIIDDTVEENVEMFTVTLSDVGGGATLGNDESIVTILASDLPFDPSRVSGWIFIDNDENPDPEVSERNGDKESDERGLGGVDVHMISLATGQTIATAITDADGFYEFGNVAPGQYEVGHDIPDEAILSVSPTELPVSIPSSGGVVVSPVNFPILETAGSVLNTLDILASSFRGDHGLEIGEKGREGGIAKLDEDGNLEFIVLGSGFDGITNAELVLNAERDAALLTVIDEFGQVRSALIDSEHLWVSSDGMGVQFLGGLNDFVFFDTDSPLNDGFDNFGNLVDQVMKDL
jgi:hypothetical protein